MYADGVGVDIVEVRLEYGEGLIAVGLLRIKDWLLGSVGSIVPIGTEKWKLWRLGARASVYWDYPREVAV